MSVVTPTQEKKFDGVRATTCELDFLSSADMLPDIMAMGAPLFGMINVMRGGDDDGGDLEVLMLHLATAMGGGRLRGMLPRLLNRTDVYVPTGERGEIERVDLTSEDQINKAFVGRKKFAMSVIRWVLEVNFKDFLDVGALIGLRTRTRKQPSSRTSSPNTAVDTSDTDSSSEAEPAGPS